jgi:hypothetical protein
MYACIVVNQLEVQRHRQPENGHPEWDNGAKMHISLVTQYQGRRRSHFFLSFYFW